MQQVYSYQDTNEPEIKFLEWKIKEDSKISKGTILFLYEKNLKIQKYASPIGGVTVKELREIPSRSIITSGTELFTCEKCLHHIIMRDLCADCGEDLRREENKQNELNPPEYLSLVHTNPALRVNEEKAKEFGKNDLKALVKNRKLVLLVDLDHTLIHTTCDPVSNDLEGVHHYELGHRGIWYHTKFRPGCNEFLQKMSKLFELHVVTFGERKYAHKITDYMDPERKYFHDRILSRNEIFNPSSKTDNLRSLFPCGDLMVCIIDDRDDVWNYAKNLICVQPYVYFKNTGDINDPKLQNKPNRLNPDVNKTDTIVTEATVDDTDDYLVHLERILKTIHDEYYKEYENIMRLKHHTDDQVNESDIPDMKRILPSLKSGVLENVVITFSGVIPTGYELTRQKCYQMATTLGARVNKHLILNQTESVKFGEPLTTHLVAANYGTSKVHDALKVAQQNKDLFIVTPEWLLQTNQKWLRCDEGVFSLTKDYDYKTCQFHLEYNYIQQRQLKTSSSSSATSVSAKRYHTGDTLTIEVVHKKHKHGEFKQIEESDSGEDSEDTTTGVQSFEISNDDLEIMNKEIDESDDDDGTNKSSGTASSVDDGESSNESSTATSSNNNSLNSSDDEFIQSIEQNL